MEKRKNKKLAAAQKVDQFIYFYNIDTHTRAKIKLLYKKIFKVFNTLQNATCCEKMNTEIKKVKNRLCPIFLTLKNQYAKICKNMQECFIKGKCWKIFRGGIKQFTEIKKYFI